MGCLPPLLARVAMFGVWIGTPLVGRAFHRGIGAWLLQLLGVLFLPVTTLTYVVVYALGNGVNGAAWLWVVLALLFDLALYETAVHANRHRISGTMGRGGGTSA